MKIYAYDVQEAERAPFEAAAREMNVTLDMTDAQPSPSSVYDADKYDAVSVRDSESFPPCSAIPDIFRRGFPGTGAFFRNMVDKIMNMKNVSTGKNTGDRGLIAVIHHGAGSRG